MVHSYKLIYFNLRGRAELIRILFHYAGVHFEDFRIEWGDWPQHKALKAELPFGQVPTLEIDGKILLGQSQAIARYLARQFGLAGRDELEQARVNMFADNINDLMFEMRPALLESNPEKQKELYRKFISEFITSHLVLAEKRLTENGTGYLVGNELTWADLAYYTYFSFLTDKCDKDVLKSAPKLKALVDRIGNIPNIKKWVSVRPDTII